MANTRLARRWLPHEESDQCPSMSIGDMAEGGSNVRCDEDQETRDSAFSNLGIRTVGVWHVAKLSIGYRVGRFGLRVS